MGRIGWMGLSWLLNGKIKKSGEISKIKLIYTYSAIPPNHDLQYEFNITQTGTFWIHSHYMVTI